MLICLEGIDGSGKGTQASLLAERSRRAGLRVATYSFPRYGKNPFGDAVGWYLNGRFGDVSDVAPQLAALLYAGDRFATKAELVASCRSHDIVVADRYVPSNLAHQAAKLPDTEQEDFIVWLCQIEYEIYGVPRPDLVFHLALPVEVAVELVSRKKERDYTSLSADIHERDIDYLRRCKDIYDKFAKKNINDEWCRVECVAASGELRNPNEIHDVIWTAVMQRLNITEANTRT